MNYPGDKVKNGHHQQSDVPVGQREEREGEGDFGYDETAEKTQGGEFEGKFFVEIDCPVDGENERPVQKEHGGEIEIKRPVKRKNDLDAQKRDKKRHIGENIVGGAGELDGFALGRDSENVAA